jgi:hypothetical protein
MTSTASTRHSESFLLGAVDMPSVRVGVEEFMIGLAAPLPLALLALFLWSSEDL